jgi:hypothetical protein
MNQKIKQQLAALDEDLRLLLTDLDGYSELKLNQKPSENGWTVFQVMHHLIRTEDLSLKYVQKKLSFNPDLPKAGLLAYARKLVLKNYIKYPFKVRAPASVGENLPDYSTFWEVAKIWKNQREELNAYLTQLPSELFDKEIYKHPMAGKMTLGAMVEFFHAHFKRHKKQIMRTLEAVDAVKIK